MNNDALKQKIEFIKGVGPQKASLLNSEVGIYNLFDMVQYFPFRYEDRSKIEKLGNVNEECVDPGSKLINSPFLKTFPSTSINSPSSI